ncbi:BLUF domain-containing protein [Hyphobacterium sp.]|uniref:BLUF domain-containing protein n=1 Tax=Hyphobacterium sp. TaxID=2004662 RepID=UPI003BAD8F45
MELSRLVYVSQAVVPMHEGALEDILSAARDNNSRHKITGLLLFDGAHFMQLLEGPTEAVEQTFSAIIKDKRHKGVVRIASETGVNRQFPGWSMGYAFTRDENLPDSSGWFPLTNGSLQAALPSKVDPSMRVLFTSFLTVNAPA